MIDGYLCSFPGPDSCPDIFRDCRGCEYCFPDVSDVSDMNDYRLGKFNLSVICPVNGIACPIMQELPIESRTLSVCFQNCDVREIIAEEFAL